MKADHRYAHLLIKEYEFWTLYLNEKQLPYIGRCYAWWKDTSPDEGEGMKLSSLSPAAMQEVFGRIFDDVCTAMGALGYPTAAYGSEFLLNTCYLANELVHNHHMHVHFIPRSTAIVSVHDRVADTHIFSSNTDWGRNYSQPKGLPQPPPAKLEIVRNTMAEAIR